MTSFWEGYNVKIEIPVRDGPPMPRHAFPALTCGIVILLKGCHKGNNNGLNSIVNVNLLVLNEITDSYNP